MNRRDTAVNVTGKLTMFCSRAASVLLLCSPVFCEVPQNSWSSKERSVRCCQLLCHAFVFPVSSIILWSLKRISVTRKQRQTLSNLPKNVDFFYGEELLDTVTTRHMDDHPLSALRGCLFGVPTLSPYLHSVSSIRKLRKCFKSCVSHKCTFRILISLQ